MIHEYQMALNHLGLCARRLKLTAEMADNSNLVKTLVIKAEDARLLGDMVRRPQPAPPARRGHSVGFVLTRAAGLFSVQSAQAPRPVRAVPLSRPPFGRGPAPSGTLVQQLAQPTLSRTAGAWVGWWCTGAHAADAAAIPMENPYCSCELTQHGWGLAVHRS